MKACRITAEYVDNANETLVFVGVVGPEGRLVPGQLLGYVKDADGPNEEIGTYPFLIEPVPHSHKGDGQIFWGDWGRHCPDFADAEDIDVFRVPMVVGEYIARRNGEDESVYRITYIVPMD